MRWICATTAPWALAAGLLVSFTAAASNDVNSGFSFSPRSPVTRLTEAGLVPPVGAAAALAGKLDLSREILRTTHRYDLPEDATVQGAPPRPDMKTNAGSYPVVERTLKGARAAPNRVTLSDRARELHASLTPSGSRLLFSRNENLLPPTILMEGKLEAPEMEPQGFEPWQAPELTTTRQATSIQSPAAAAAGSTGAAASPTTPFVKRAVVLSSTTPAPADATPIEIAAAPVSRMDKNGIFGTTSIARSEDDRPRYADLIDPDNLSKEQRCLAEAVYFEARSESEEGQAAVAQVVLNRVKSGLYPSSICGVVYQNRHRHLACQFTFACEGKALRVTEPEPWDRAKRIASAVLEGKTYLADVGGATHYHASYVRPYWAKRLKKMDVIGRHVFYKLRPGQT